MKALPLKPSVAYPEQINVRVDQELKQLYRDLNAKQVDVAKICRDALRDSLERAQGLLQKELASG